MGFSGTSARKIVFEMEKRKESTKEEIHLGEGNRKRVADFASLEKF